MATSGSHTVIRPTTVSVEASVIYRTLTVPATTHQKYTLALTKGSLGELPTYTTTATSAAQTLSVPYGTTYTITYSGDTGYNGGAGKSGTVNATNVSVAHNGASLKYNNLSIGATTSQTYAVTVTADSTYGGTIAEFTSNGSAAQTKSEPYNASYTVSYTAAAATNAYTYTATETKSGKIIAGTAVPAATAISTLRYWTLSVPATTSQTYTLSLGTNATYGGNLPSYTATATKSAQSLSVPYGTTYKIIHTADNATAAYSYTAGASQTGSVTGTTNVTHNAATSTLRSYTLSHGATSNQTYTITLKSGSYGGNIPSGVATATSSASIINNIPYGTTYTIVHTAANDYYTETANHTGSITGDKTFNDDNGTLKTYTLSVPATTSQSYTLTLTKGSYGALPGYTSTAVKTAQYLTVPYSTSYKIVYTADTQTAAYSYTAGSSKTGTITATSTIAHNAATSTVRSYTFSHGSTTNQTYTVTFAKGSYANVNVYTSTAQSAAYSVVQPYGTTYTVTHTAVDSNYFTATGIHTGTITAATTLADDGATSKTYTLSIPAATSQTYTLSLTKGTYGTLPSYTSNTKNAQTLTVPYSTSYKLTYSADAQTAAYTYTAGSSKTGTVIADTTVTHNTATSTLRSYTFSKGAIGNNGGTYTLTLTQGSYGGTVPSYTSTAVSTAQSISNVPYGTTYKIVWTAGSATAPYTFSAPSSVTGTVTGSITNNTQMNSTLRSYTFSHTSTTNQKYTVTLTQGSYGGTVPSGVATATNSATTISNVPYGTAYTVAHTTDAAGYYTAADNHTGTVTGNINLTDNPVNVNSYTLSVPATTSQTYTLTLVKGTYGTLPSYTSSATSSAQSLNVPYGTSYTIVHTAASANNYYTYSAGASQNGTVSKATTITHNAATSSIRYFTVNFGSTTHQGYAVAFTSASNYSVGTIPGNLVNSSIARSVSMPIGTKWTVTYSPDEGYNAGATITDSKTATNDYTQNHNVASLKYLSVSIPATTSQTYTLTMATNAKWGGNLPSYTSNATSAAQNFSNTIPYGTTISCVHSATEATAAYTYTKGADHNHTIKSNSTLAHNAVTSTLRTYYVSHGATTNQTYTLTLTKNTTYGGNVPSYTSTAVSSAMRIENVPYGTTYTVAHTAVDGSYFTPTGNHTGSVTGNTDLDGAGTDGDSATLKIFTLSVPATTSQTYTLTLTKGTYGSLPSYTSTATKSAQTLTVPYGTTYICNHTADGATDAYTYTATANHSGTITTHTTLGHGTGNSATSNLRYYTFSHGSTTNQTYTLTLTKDSNYGGTVPAYTSTATSAAQSINVPYNTSYTVTHTPLASGYFTATGNHSGKVTAATSFAGESIGSNTFTLSVPAAPDHEKYTLTLTKGTYGVIPSYTDTATTGAQTISNVPYGTTYKLTYSQVADWHHTYTAGASKTGTITANSTLSHNGITGSSLIYYSVSIPVTTSQSYTLAYSAGTYGGTIPTYTSTATKNAQTFNTTIPAGTTYKITYTADSANWHHSYTAGTSKTGTISANSTIVHNGATSTQSNYSMTHTSVGNMTYTIALTQGSYGGTVPTKYTDNTAITTARTAAGTITVIPAGTTYTVTHTPTATGYFTAPSNHTGTVSTNINIGDGANGAATTLNVNSYTLSVVAPSNEGYKLTLVKGTYGTLPAYNSTTYVTNNTSLSVPYGTSYTIAYSAAAQTAYYTYTAGANKTGIVTGNTIVGGTNATVAHNAATSTVRSYTITHSSTTNENYTITLTKGSYANLNAYTSTAQTGSYTTTQPAGTSYTITHTPTAAGYFTATGSHTGTLTSDVAFGPENLSVNTFTVSVPATTNETYTLTLTKGTYGTLPAYSSTAISTAQTVSNVPYGTTYTLTYAGGQTETHSYTPGAAKSGTITAATTLTHNGTTASTVRSYTFSHGTTTGESYSVAFTKGTYGTLTTSAWDAAKSARTCQQPAGTTYVVTYTADTTTAQYTYSATGQKTGTINASTGIGNQTAGSVTNSYTVTLGTHDHASVVLSGNGKSATNADLTAIPYGTTVTATATEDTGYKIDGISFT